MNKRTVATIKRYVTIIEDDLRGVEEALEMEDKRNIGVCAWNLKLQSALLLKHVRSRLHD